MANNTLAQGANTVGMSRHNSFTILDPASGIPSDESFYSFSKTPRLASLTSRHSFEKMHSHGGSTNLASTLAALTGGVPNTNPSATITSAIPSKRSELPSLAPLPPNSTRSSDFPGPKLSLNKRLAKASWTMRAASAPLCTISLAGPTITKKAASAKL